MVPALLNGGRSILLLIDLNLLKLIDEVVEASKFRFNGIERFLDPLFFSIPGSVLRTEFVELGAQPVEAAF